MSWYKGLCRNRTCTNTRNPGLTCFCRTSSDWPSKSWSLTRPNSLHPGSEQLECSFWFVKIECAETWLHQRLHRPCLLICAYSKGPSRLKAARFQIRSPHDFSPQMSQCSRSLRVTWSPLPMPLCNFIPDLSIYLTRAQPFINQFLDLRPRN